MTQGVQEKEWVDKVIDLNKAVEILREHHPDGKFTLLKSLDITNDNNNMKIVFDPAIIEINEYLIEKHGKKSGY